MYISAVNSVTSSCACCSLPASSPTLKAGCSIHTRPINNYKPLNQTQTAPGSHLTAMQTSKPGLGFFLSAGSSRPLMTLSMPPVLKLNSGCGRSTCLQARHQSQHGTLFRADVHVTQYKLAPCGRSTCLQGQQAAWWYKLRDHVYDMAQQQPATRSLSLSDGAVRPCCCETWPRPHAVHMQDCSMITKLGKAGSASMMLEATHSMQSFKACLCNRNDEQMYLLGPRIGTALASQQCGPMKNSMRLNC